MATRDDEVIKTIIERATTNSLLLAMSDDALKITRLNERESATFMGKGQSTLAHERSSQAALPADQRDPRSIGCIPYIPGAAVEYRLYDLLEHVKNEEPVSGVVKPRSEKAKEMAAATIKANAAKRSKLDQERRAAALNTAHRGFGAFMQTATGADTWAFSIQNDGRPMDLYGAILDNKLTGHAERLNLREFADRLADAASQAGSNQEADEIGAGIRIPKKSKKSATGQKKNKVRGGVTL